MKLNLGCGSDDRREGWCNVDAYRESDHHHSPTRLDVQADAHHLPFDDGAVEHVRCRHVLEHLERPLDALREMHRVTEPGGTLYLEVPHPVQTQGEEEEWHAMHIYSWTRGSLQRIVDRVGYVDVEWHMDHEESQPQGHAVTARR